MKPNPTFAKMLDNYRPDLGSHEVFLQQVERRLEVADLAKQYIQETTHHHYRRLLISFIIGIVVGMGAGIYLLWHPVMAVYRPEATLAILRHANLTLSLLVAAIMGVCTIALCMLLFSIIYRQKNSPRTT